MTEGSMDDKTANRRELLDRLKLDRSAPESQGGGAVKGGVIGLVLGAALAGGAAFFLWPEAQGPAVAASAPATASPGAATPAPATSAPKPVPGDAVLSASGYVTARRIATVSAEIIGKMQDMLVEEGTVVEAGQVVARLDPTLAKLDRDVAAADRDAARADKSNADATLRRLEGVPRGSVVSEAELTRARADAATAAARLSSAEARLGRAEALLAKYEIRAPFAGVVTSKDAQPGEIVSPSAAGGGSTRTGICTVVDMTSLEIEVEVSESFISRVKPGQPVRAALDAYPDWEIPAKVAAIIPTANRDKATVKVRIALLAQDPRILPEMAAKVSFMDSGNDSGSAE
ncbi:MAG: efflux RND transporter periplasmic adaptor subunit [Micropepsaceae bacterium]